MGRVAFVTEFGRVPDGPERFAPIEGFIRVQVDPRGNSPKNAHIDCIDRRPPGREI